MIGLQLLENVNARPLLGLLLEHFVLLFAGQIQFVVDLDEAFLAIFDRAALSLRVEFLRFDIDRKLVQAGFQARALFFELNFFGGKFFKSDDIALLLQIQRSDFVARAAEILGRRKCVGLRNAQSFLLAAQIIFDFA